MGFSRLKCMLQEVPIMIGCWNWLYNHPSGDPKRSFQPPSNGLESAYELLGDGRRRLLGRYLILTIRYTWLGLSALFMKKQLFITIIYLRFYQNAMTLSSPRINGVATICFFSWLPPTKLIKFVTARQQMKRTVGATP